MKMIWQDLTGYYRTQYSMVKFCMDRDRYYGLIIFDIS